MRYCLTVEKLSCSVRKNSFSISGETNKDWILVKFGPIHLPTLGILTVPAFSPCLGIENYCYVWFGIACIHIKSSCVYMGISQVAADCQNRNKNRILNASILQCGALIQVSFFYLLTDFHRIASNVILLRFLLPYQFLLELAIFLKKIARPARWHGHKRFLKKPCK